MVKTKVAIQKSPASIDRVQAPRSSWENTADLYNSLTTDTAFFELCHQQGVDISDTQSPEYAHATSDYVSQFCETRLHDGTLSETIAAQLLLTANLPSFFWQQAELNQLRARKNTRQTYKERQRLSQLKDSVISYNQLASNYLYEHPDTSLNDIVATAASTSLSYVPSHAGGPREQLTMLRGARTEALGRGLLDRLSAMIPDRLTYRPSTVEEDKRGADVMVTFDGRQFGLDFKSSLEGVESLSNGEYTQHIPGVDFQIQQNYRQSDITMARVVPQIDEKALGGQCRLPDAEILPAVLHLGDQLVKMYKLSASSY